MFLYHRLDIVVEYPVLFPEHRKLDFSHITNVIAIAKIQNTTQTLKPKGQK